LAAEVPGAAGGVAKAERIELSREINPSAAATALTSESRIDPDLWLDPDVRWLTGVHEADRHEYLVRESYEELLWWLQLPDLLNLAAQTGPARHEVQRIASLVREDLEAAAAAQYRVDVLRRAGKGVASPKAGASNDEPASTPLRGESIERDQGMERSATDENLADKRKE
jgi:hypothetical protein